MNKIIINPFEKFTEVQLLVSGLALAVGGSLLGHLFNMQFDGVMDVHPYPGITLARSFTDNAINTLSLFLLLFVLGLVINKKTRFIDVLNIALIARSPFYLLALGNANDFFIRLETHAMAGNKLSMHFSAAEIAMLLVFSIFTIAFLVWFVVLLYNGFKTATNLKLTWHKVAFGFAVLLAEVLSKILLSLI